MKYTDIEALAGGGDMDTAYICFYRKLEAFKTLDEWINFMKVYSNSN